MSEQALLGALLIDPSRLDACEITREDFAAESHRQVFEAITSLVGRRHAVDVITVDAYLQASTGKQWLPILGRLVEDVPSPRLAPDYARLVKQAAVRRRAIAIADTLKSRVNEDGMACVDEAVRALLELGRTSKSWEVTGHGAASAAVDYLEQAMQANGLVGLTSGLTDLDEHLGGFHRSDLTVIGARTSMGKTATLLNFLDNVSEPVGLISAEQGHAQVGLRLIAKNGQINAHQMRIGKLTNDDWSRTYGAVDHIAKKRVWIYDKPAPTIEEVVRQARKWHHEHAIRALYVDYLQRIRSTTGTDLRQQVRHIVMTLKETARELDIPVVALAQVGRGVATRADKRPLISDLKEAGDIEQEADNILLLYRDEVYDPNTPEKGILEIHVAKNRHGPTGTIKCAWQADTMTLRDLAHGYAQ